MLKNMTILIQEIIIRHILLRNTREFAMICLHM